MPTANSSCGLFDGKRWLWVDLMCLVLYISPLLLPLLLLNELLRQWGNPGPERCWALPPARQHLRRSQRCPLLCVLDPQSLYLSFPLSSALPLNTYSSVVASTQSQQTGSLFSIKIDSPVFSVIHLANYTKTWWLFFKKRERQANKQTFIISEFLWT